MVNRATPVPPVLPVVHVTPGKTSRLQVDFKTLSYLPYCKTSCSSSDDSSSCCSLPVLPVPLVPPVPPVKPVTPVTPLAKFGYSNQLTPN
jgi:hypothetical protein